MKGNGYNDVGKIIFDAGSELKNAKYLSILGLVNNEAMLEKNKGKWDKFGDSIDIAFLALSRKLKTNDTEFKKVDVIPYESLKKYSAVFFKMDDKMYCTAKGSVEVILDFCSYSMVDGVKKKIDKEKILKQNDELASSGYRVIALCSKEIKEKEKYDERDLDEVLLEKENKVYFLLNKPREVVCTTEDDKHRKIITSLIDTDLRVFPVGRLDYDTTGLIILTNDGEFANLMTSPKNKIEKVYIAKINGKLLPNEMMALKKGVIIDGKKTRKSRVKIKKYDKKTDTSIIEIGITEGRNHQVKRMFNEVGHKVLKLKRERNKED